MYSKGSPCFFLEHAGKSLVSSLKRKIKVYSRPIVSCLNDVKEDAVHEPVYKATRMLI
jgi:hypothetical protein